MEGNLQDKINRILEEEEKRLKRKKYTTDASLWIAGIVLIISILIANHLRTLTM